MIQPKYKMGEEVIVTLTMEHKESGLTLETTARGTVCRVGFDPRNTVDGIPFYFYSIDIGLRGMDGVQEHELQSIE